MSKISVSDRIDHENRIASLHASASTNVGKLAGAIKKFIEEGYSVDVVSIGAGAVNQSVKAAASASGMLTSLGLELLVKPSFTEVSVEGVPRTAIRLFIITRRPN